LLNFALEEKERTGDPIWASIEVVESALMGEFHGARAAMGRSFPGLLKDPPDIEGYRGMDAIIAASVLQRTGSPERAKQILEATLREMSKARFQAADQLALKGMVLAALGRNTESIAAFDAAAKAGWRSLIEFEYFVRLEDFSFMAEVARDPRFKRIVAGIEADNARMRENFLKVRRPPGDRGSLARTAPERRGAAAPLPDRPRRPSAGSG
jgi:hypothetical protein